MTFFRRGQRFAANVSIVWNILGSIDLIAAIFLGITTSNPQLSAVPVSYFQYTSNYDYDAMGSYPHCRSSHSIDNTHNHSLAAKRKKSRKKALTHYPGESHALEIRRGIAEYKEKIPE